MKTLFEEITENASYHNQNNYEAFDKLTDYLMYGWDNTSHTEKKRYTAEEKLYDTIPMDFVEEWCDNWDAEADGLQWAVDIILK